MDTLGMSAGAHRISKAAASARAGYEIRAIGEHERMVKGPYLEDIWGDQFIVIPSDWYKEEAKDFWKSKGFRFSNSPYPVWMRSTDLKLDGKKFSPEMWLQAAKRKFQEFYGEDLEQVERQLAASQ